MTIAKSLPKESVLAVTSVPVKVGMTAAGEAPGSRSTVPPAALMPPPSIATLLLLMSCRLVAAERVIPALTVMVPLVALPMTSVPAVMRSSSASVRPSRVAVSSEPKSMPRPVVVGAMVTLLVPAETEEAGSK